MLTFEPGLARDVAIGLKYVIIAVCGQFALLFARDWVKARREGAAVQLIPAWLVFFGAFAATEVLYTLGDLYGVAREDLLDAGYSLMLAAATGVVFAFESALPYHTRGFFWKFTLGTTIATLLLPRDSSRFVLFWVVGPVLLVFILMVVHYQRKRLRERASRPIWWFFTGFFAVLAGTVLSADYLVEPFGVNAYLVGNVVSALGFVVMGFTSLGLRSLKELEWFTAVQHLFFTYRGGALLYHVSFSGVPTSEAQDTLAAGGLSGINALLKEISQSEADVRYIDQQNRALLFYHGEKVVGILFAKYYLDALYWKVRRLVTTIETAFRPLLGNPQDYPRVEEGIAALVAAEFGPAMGNPA